MKCLKIKWNNWYKNMEKENIKFYKKVFILEKTEITKTTALIMCTVIILGLIMYIFIIKEFAKKEMTIKN